MSRTYRRTEKGNKASWMPGFYYRKELENCDDKEKEFFEKHPKLIGDYFNWMTTPSHWNRDFNNVPKRREAKRLCRDIVRGYRDAEEVVFPADKKPHIYYW